MDLRCENGIKFGEINDGVLEVKCRSNRCGARQGIVVIHRYDCLTGRPLRTRRFKDPVPSHRKEATANGRRESTVWSS